MHGILDKIHVYSTHSTVYVTKNRLHYVGLGGARARKETWTFVLDSWKGAEISIMVALKRHLRVICKSQVWVWGYGEVCVYVCVCV